MTGFDRKTLRLSQDSNEPVTFTIQVDITGDATWVSYGTFTVPAGQSVSHEFPAGFGAYWVRVIADRPCRATAQMMYQ